MLRRLGARLRHLRGCGRSAPTTSDRRCGAPPCWREPALVGHGGPAYPLGMGAGGHRDRHQVAPRRRSGGVARPWALLLLPSARGAADRAAALVLGAGIVAFLRWPALAARRPEPSTRCSGCSGSGTTRTIFLRPCCTSACVAATHHRYFERFTSCPPSSSWSARAGQDKPARARRPPSRARPSGAASAPACTRPPPRSRTRPCARSPVSA